MEIKITEFSIGLGIYCKFIGNGWSIIQFDERLNKNGMWEYTPLPSNRDNDFYNRTVWNTAEEAILFYWSHK